ncbi:IS1 family transposase [Xenorhabdus anantnagensis]
MGKSFTQRIESENLTVRNRINRLGTSVIQRFFIFIKFNEIIIIKAP